jgi:hypothetical protein
MRIQGFLGLVFLAACYETQRANYDDYAAAQAAGAVERGWIPDFVPLSATTIAEAHDLDLNTQRLRFQLPEADLQQLVSRLEPIPLAQVWPPDVRSPDLDGDWPSDLTGIRHTQRSSFRTYRLKDTKSGTRCLAVDALTRTVYAWSCTAPSS